MPPEQTQVRCLDILMPGKALAWFGALGLLDSFWSTHYLQLPAFFPTWPLVSLLLCGLALIALCRLPVISPFIALAAFVVALASTVVQGEWVAGVPLVGSVGVVLAWRMQQSGMRGRYVSLVAGVLCAFVSVLCLWDIPGIRVSPASTLGVLTHIDALLGLIFAYAIIMASWKPLAQPVPQPILSVITVCGTFIAVAIWFVLAEQDRLVHFELLGHLGGQNRAPEYMLPLGRWLPDLMFLICLIFTWLLTRTLRLSVILLERSSELEYASSHDQLTALPNKRTLLSAIKTACLQAETSGERVSIVLLDLNGLKLINDSIGLQVGDQILTELARRIRSAVAPDHLVARLEGDEFVVLLVGASRAEAIQCAKKTISVIAQPFHHQNIELHLTASAGLTTASNKVIDPTSLLREADLALTHSKHGGRNTWREYSPELASNIDVRLAMRADLQKALDNGHFVMHYQPLINGYTGRVMGAEALIRWPHADRGYISPSVFVPLAEEAGLIYALSLWILDATCRDLHWIKSRVLVDFPFIVNVSPLHFARPDFISDITDTLAKYDLPLDSIEIEITEGLFLDNVQETIGKLRNLQSMGIKVSIDDFGTGYSSLRYLKNLPVDKIKIDRSFVQDIVSDRNDAAISKAIIGLAHHLNLKVVAEGVETSAQYWFLKRNFCDEFQGYLFARAMPVEVLAQRLQQNGGVEALPMREVPIDDDRTLLLLDDEENILKALQRALRRDGYTIYRASTTQEAFDILAAHPIKVILSDQRLEDMTGTEFFRRVKNIYPDTIRIILSGYSDLKSVTEAINHGAIYKFLSKPWDETELRQELVQAFKVAARRQAGPE